MSKELTGRVALVTGANRGIGRAVALGPANAGTDVAVNFRSHRSALWAHPGGSSFVIGPSL